MLPVRRTLASAALAGAVLAADVVLLTLLLNPQVSLAREALPLSRALFLPCWLTATAVLCLLAAFLAVAPGLPRPVQPPVEGLPWFATLAAVAALAAAALYWHNALAYRHSVPLAHLRALVGSALGQSASALVLLAVVAEAALFSSRERPLAAPLVVLAAAAGVVVPLALRPGPETPRRPVSFALEAVQPARRVRLLAVDGLGPEHVRRALERGTAPGLARLVRRGARGPLATLRPTEGPPVWTSMFTGCLPRDHGVKSFVVYRLHGSGTVYELLPKGALVGAWERAGLVSPSSVPSSVRRRRALWNVLNAFGIQAGVVRFWATHPAERVQGFMLSNYFHLLHADARRAAEAVHPPDLLPEVRAKAVDAAHVDPALVAEFVEPETAADAAAEPGGAPWRRELVDRALAPDLSYRRAAAVLRSAYDPPFFALHAHGLEVVGHAFTRYAEPERFGNVAPEEARRYGRVVDRYTSLVAGWVDEEAKALRPGEILLVVSGYGMEPVPVWRRLLGVLSGSPPPSGSHAGAPDGFLLAVGDGIREGAQLRGGSVLDVTPTVLYLMGLPVGHDMAGRALTEIVTGEFARAHPLTFIPSYESLAVTPFTGPPDPGLPPLPDEP